MGDLNLIRQNAYFDKCCAAVGSKHLYGYPSDGSLKLFGCDVGGYDTTGVVVFKKNGRRMFVSFYNGTDEIAKFELEIVDPDRYVDDLSEML